MNSKIIDRIRKRRREDDEDMMFFIRPALHRMRNRGPIEKKQRHSSILYGKKRVNDILTGHVKNCLVAYRMEPHIFLHLASYLRRENLISDKRIKVEEKLAFFLYMVSHNASYEDLQLEFQHSGQTFHEYINEFFNIVPVLASRFLKPPNIDEPHAKISTDPRFYPYFQNCLGAIDGSHVPITVTPGIAAPFRNRKGTLSHNIMVACDFDLKFTFISCGWEGSATDSWPEISKFQTKPFPLYDKLGDLYDGHIAEGNFNFTSIEATQVSDGDHEVEREETAFSFDLNQYGDDLHMYDDPRDAAQTGAPGGSNKKPVKEPKKKKRDDPMVEVMAQYVEIKRKQAEEESALLAGSKNAQEFSINKCIAVLHKMESIPRAERAAAYKVFKNAENREIFLNSAAEDEESAAVFLRSEMAELPQRI